MTVRIVRIAGAITLVAIVVAAGTALTAGNVVPGTSLGQATAGIDANALAPAACSSLDLEDVVEGDDGTTGNDLLLGTDGDDTMQGNGGKDCILGGAGDDTLEGTGGSVCIGGPGTDDVSACGGG